MTDNEQNSSPKTLPVVIASVLIAGLCAWAGGRGGAQVGGLPVLLLCAALAFALNWACFFPAYAARTERYYDLVGSATHLSLVGCATLLAEPDPRGWLLAGLAAVWALRLGSFLFLRIHRAGSDRRFDEVKQDFGQFLIAWTLQALWVFLTLCCALAAITITSAEPQPLGVWAVVGGLVWALGFGVEVAADRQKSVFRKDPANAGRFISSGLWAWSRHPNYCGEIVLWVGVAVIALPALSGWQYVTLVSPLFVYVLLTSISGVPPLEKRAEEKWGDDPEYRTYVERTPVLWLRPPRSS
ncbi:MAG: steroid 5-alpha reductase family enzyme [Planctomycetota bacterium]|jgi:steroid 5-alpha reductase family enzyme